MKLQKLLKNRNNNKQNKRIFSLKKSQGNELKKYNKIEHLKKSKKKNVYGFRL